VIFGLFVSVDVATIELMEYPLMEIVMALGTALVNVTVKLTLVVVRPGRAGEVPAVGVPYTTMFFTAVENVLVGKVDVES
jgi:hypothetical protein